MMLHILLLVAELLLNVAHAQHKSAQLHLLATIVETGNEPLDGTSCKIAIQIVLDAINNSSKLLPFNQLKPVFKDEGGGSLMVTDKTLNFLSSMEQTGSLVAPITIGAWFTSGCRSLARLMKRLNLVQVTFGCNSATVTRNRVRFPNTYRAGSTSDLLAFPYLKFMTDVGKWSRISIITSATNSFDLSIALRIRHEAELNNITVSHFDITSDVTEQTIQLLMDSDPRIIDFQIAVPPLIVRFMCLAHKFGLTGPRYTFMFLLESFFEPSDVPVDDGNGCTRKIIESQMEMSLWIGWQSEDLEYPDKVLLTGYNLTEFDRRFLQISGGKKPPDFGQRLICHDGALNAVLALDRADKALRQKNLSLADWRLNPEIVSHAVNNSVAGASFDGLRLKNFRYEPVNLEMDPSEVLTVSRWTRNGGLQVHYRDKVKNGTDPLKLENHYMEEVEPFYWLTKSGRSQNDRTIIEKIEKAKIPRELFYGVIVAAGLTFLPVGKLICKISSADEYVHVIASASKISSIALFMASSILFLATTSLGLCYLQPIILALSFAFLQSFMICVIATISKIPATQNLNIRDRSSMASNSMRPSRVSQRKESAPVKAMENPVKFKTAAFSAPWPVLITVLILSVWFLSDTVRVVKVELLEMPEHNAFDDVIYQHFSLECQYGRKMAWPLTLALLNLGSLLVQAIFIYRLTVHAWLKTCLSLKQVRFAVANAIFLLMGTIFIIVVLPEIWTRRLAISIASLLLGSALTLSCYLKNI